MPPQIARHSEDQLCKYMHQACVAFTLTTLQTYTLGFLEVYFSLQDHVALQHTEWPNQPQPH